MSQLFAIGINYYECEKTPIIRSLKDNAFYQADSVRHCYIVEAKNALKDYKYKLDWYFAIAEDNSPNLDIAYQIPQEIESGSLKEITDIIIKNKRIKQVGVFIYDLGTRQSDLHIDLELDEIKSTLKSWYEFGGPERTVFHLFIRKQK